VVHTPGQAAKTERYPSGSGPGRFLFAVPEIRTVTTLESILYAVRPQFKPRRAILQPLAGAQADLIRAPNRLIGVRRRVCDRRAGVLRRSVRVGTRTAV
jgi:hypothetical protein